MKPKNPDFSAIVEAACDMMEEAARDYTWNAEQIVIMDKLTQDLLHKLELEDLTYSERAKIATQLKRCRKERRGHKDTVAVLEPLVTFLDTEKGRNLKNLLKEVLGRTRKAEERLENRVYLPRVLQES